MPLIEELPLTRTIRASHGWTYVPDTGAPLPIPAVQLGSRKRGRDGTSTAAAQSTLHKLSAKQEKAIQQRLHDLIKENYREATFPVPKRESAKSREKKTTGNVKRILAYNRTFQHYLADEEAGVNVYGSAGNAPPSTTRTGSQAGLLQQKSTGDLRKWSAPKDAISTPAQKGGARRASLLRHSKTAPVKAEEAANTSKADVEMVDAPSHPSSPTAPQKSPSSSRQKQQSRPSSPTTGQKLPPTYDPAMDKDPLLRTLDVPKLPSDRIMQALLSEPPLSYTAARAKPLNHPTDESGQGAGFAIRMGNNTLTAKPQRWFCSVCGYWGKVRCKYGCGERVCGLLECWRGHEGVCALAATGY